MADKYGFSDLECKIVLNQIERRAKYRKEFLKLRTDPCEHSRQAGYVVVHLWSNGQIVNVGQIAVKFMEMGCSYVLYPWFDKAIQHFISMKGTTLEYFPFNLRTISFALFTIVLPMSSLGYVLWSTRTERERNIRCGKLKPKDRGFKLC